MRLCGTPDEEFMNRITSQEARNYIRTLPFMKKKNFKEEFKNANEHGIFCLNSIVSLTLSILIFLHSCGSTGKDVGA